MAFKSIDNASEMLSKIQIAIQSLTHHLNFESHKIWSVQCKKRKKASRKIKGKEIEIYIQK